MDFHDDTPCFRDHVQAASRLSWSEAHVKRGPQNRPRRQGASRKARTQRPMPVRQRALVQEVLPQDRMLSTAWIGTITNVNGSRRRPSVYIPAAFAETDPARLHEFMRLNSFAVLTSNGRGGLLASHLPLLFDADAGPPGHLLGHMARANPAVATGRRRSHGRLPPDLTPMSRRPGTMRRGPSRPGTTSPSTPTASSASSRIETGCSTSFVDPC